MATLPRRALARRVAPAAAVAVALGVVLGAALEGIASATPHTINVTIRHSRFIPATVIARRGATVRFVVTNTDPIDHELILGDAEVQRRHETGTEPAHGAVPGEVSVPPGTSAETTYTFSRAGVVLIGCHAPGHYAYGMRGRVLVVY